MGTSYFNKGSSSAGDSPFYKLKTIPLHNKTNVEKISNFNTTGGITNLPVWRSAVSNNYFVFNSTYLEVSLYSVSSAGVSSLVSTVPFTTYLTDSNCVSAYLSTVDQCLYTLIYEAPQYRLIKVSDSSGAVTTIGSAFTPTTAARWPVEFTTILDTGVGGLEIFYRGYKHTLNKSTGAIISQDVVTTLGSFSLVNTTYISQDGTIALAPFLSMGSAVGTSSTHFHEVVSTSSGNIRSLRLSDIDISDKILAGNFGATSNIIVTDNDKIFFGAPNGASGSNQHCFGYIYRSDFDQFLQSVVDWYVGA